MKATVGGTLKLMRREDPHRLGPPSYMLTRIVRYVNAVSQDDYERLHDLLRLTANSVAASIFCPWPEAREFVATNAFVSAWRKALNTKGISVNQQKNCLFRFVPKSNREAVSFGHFSALLKKYTEWTRPVTYQIAT